MTNCFAKRLDKKKSILQILIYWYILISKETRVALRAEQRRDGQYLDIRSFFGKTFLIIIKSRYYVPSHNKMLQLHILTLGYSKII